MKVPLELSIKGMKDHNGKIEELIRTKASKLDRICNNLISCHVAVEQMHIEQHTGHSYSVRLDVRIPPHHEIVVKREPEKGKIGTDKLPKIIREAFESMERQVKELMDKMHKKIKEKPEFVAEETEEEVF